MIKKTALSKTFNNPMVLIPLLLLIVTAIAGAWFFTQFERKEIEIYTGDSPAARQNLLLAAERYLNSVGIAAESLEGMDILTDLPSTDDAVLIRNLPGGMSASIKENLLSWVEGGGHLLFMPNWWESENPNVSSIMDFFDVKYIEEEEEESDCGCPSTDEADTEETEDESLVDGDNSLPETVAAPADEKEEEDLPSYNTIIKLTLDDNEILLNSFDSALFENDHVQSSYSIDGPYHMEFKEEEDRKREDHFKEIDKEGSWLLQFEHGSGKVTIFSEIYPFYNYNIGTYDHAYFLSWLIGDANKVWLLYSTQMDSFLTILWKKAGFFWISTLLLLLSILWRFQKRSDRLLTADREKSQNILTHMDGIAMFSWRTNRMSQIVDGNRKALLAKWVRRKHGSKQTELQEMEYLAIMKEQLGVSDEILQNCFLNKVESEQDLIQAGKALQTIQSLTSKTKSTNKP